MSTRSLCVPAAVAGLLLFVGSCLCQFPRPCANSEGLRTRECCPVWAEEGGGDGSVCGAASGRGECADVRVDHAPHHPQYPHGGNDDREKWPLGFFNRTCHCFGNYSGFDCGDCAFGHYGDDCSRYRETVRRNVLALLPDERKKLVDYFDRAKNTVNPDYVIATATRDDMGGPSGESPRFADVTTLDMFAWMHYFVVHPTFLPNGGTFSNIDFAHAGSAFPVWHRVFLLHFENEIRKLTRDVDFALPYWDWRDQTECDVCTDDLMGAQDPGDPNLISPGSPFSKWKIICSLPAEYISRTELCDGTREGPLTRNPGNNDGYPTLPTTAEVELMMGSTAYDHHPYNDTAEHSFRNILEGFANATGHTGGRTQMHNAVHMYLNGSMSFSEYAANDPIFYLHHCFVDSLFERWMRKQPIDVSLYPRKDAPIGHNYDYYMVPFLPTYLNGQYFKASEQLGYEYDYLLETNSQVIKVNHGSRLNVAVQSEWSDKWSNWSKCRPACGSNDSKRFRERQNQTETQACPFIACQFGRRFE